MRFLAHFPVSTAAGTPGSAQRPRVQGLQTELSRAWLNHARLFLHLCADRFRIELVEVRDCGDPLLTQRFHGIRQGRLI